MRGTSKDNSCVKCDQVNDLVSLVVEFRDSEKGIDWWDHTLAPLKWKQERPSEKKPKIKEVLYLLPARLKRGKGVNEGMFTLEVAGGTPSSPPPLSRCSVQQV